MTVLLARETEVGSGRWSKVLMFSSRVDGSGPLPDKWNGSIESFVVRSAARFFAVDGKACEVFSQHGTCSFRATLVK